MGLRILADRNIADVEAAFAALGEVEAVRSTEITPDRVRDVDLLLVRSTVRVDAALLAGSRVRFVATATIGTDHLDLAWLGAQSIPVASAPGSNAASVAEWWLSALLAEVARPVTGLRLGVVGVGHVGSRIAALGAALGMEVSWCDPPRSEAEPDFSSTPLDELLPEVDVLTLHTPLVRDGAHPTLGLLDAARLQRLRSRAILLNCARGELVDGAAAIAAVQQNSLRLLCDVFPGEPRPDPALIAACRLATAHIAGHSLDGKLNGTLMIYRAACAFLGVPATWRPAPPIAQPSQIILDPTDRTDEELLLTLARLRYEIRRDDHALRAIVASDADRDVAAAWRALREGYGPRRELLGLRVTLTAPRPRLALVLGLLGCDVRLEAALAAGNR